MATLIRYAPNSLRREQYDKVNEILQSQGSADPPQELKLHVLFGDDGDLRVSEIWESESDWRGFYDGALKGALAEAGVEMGDPQILEVHELWGSGIANP
jgi:hypothetical protein